eukprot:scaffold16080_cov129-Isochrysis_galbana.AAC.1
MEEGDDPNFVSDTNNLITIKQTGPTLREIRDTDMGAAIRERGGATHPQRLINRTNHTISPLFCLDAEGTLSLGVSSSQTSINLSTIPNYPPSTRPVPTPYTRAPLKDTPH